MTKTTLMIAMAVCATTLCASEGSAQSREARQMMADIRMLQEQIQELALSVAALNQALDQSLQALNDRIADSGEAARRSFADQKVLLDTLANDSRQIRERADDTNVRISSLREEMEALRAAIPAAPVTAPPADPLDPAAAASATPPPPPVALPSSAGLSPARMFETARADYFAGQWSLAITGFDAFLKTFPRSDLADEAWFFIGDTYMNQNRWQDAVAAYNQVILTYAATNSVPEAYYKRGLAQERLDQTDAARASYETVAKNYPDSDGGRLAKQSLDRLTRRPQQE